MTVNGPNQIGLLARQGAKNTQLMNKIQKSNFTEMQGNVDKATRGTLQRAQSRFTQLEVKSYLRNGGIMGLGTLSRGATVDKKG